MYFHHEVKKAPFFKDLRGFFASSWYKIIQRHENESLQLSSVSNYPMRYTLFILCIWSHSAAMAQYFNLRYDLMGLNNYEVAWSVEAEEDGAFTVFMSNANLVDPYQTAIVRFANNGNVIWTNSIASDTAYIYTGLHNSTFKLDEGGGYILGASFWASERSYMHLIRYHPDGDTLWTRYWSSDFGNDEIGYSAIEDPDGNFLIAGVSDNPNQYSIGVVAKTDPNGNTLWKRYYTGYTGSTSSTIFGSIDNAFGGGYIVGGSTRSCET
ncbi:MAG: hypothetical protein ACK54P_14755, partial [Bacteroidota bacterium]